MRVVVCDNDPVALTLVVTDLGFEGHDIVATATNGLEAVDRCVTYRPEVLVVDLRMPPGIDGVAAARAALAEVPAMGVVIHTNHLDDDALRGARELGASYVLKGELRALRRAVLVAGQRHGEGDGRAGRG
jgi:two-component system response regulator AlgR